MCAQCRAGQDSCWARGQQPRLEQQHAHVPSDVVTSSPCRFIGHLKGATKYRTSEHPEKVALKWLAAEEALHRFVLDSPPGLVSASSCSSMSSGGSCMAVAC